MNKLKDNNPSSPKWCLLMNAMDWSWHLFFLCIQPCKKESQQLLCWLLISQGKASPQQGKWSAPPSLSTTPNKHDQHIHRRPPLCCIYETVKEISTGMCLKRALHEYSLVWSSPEWKSMLRRFSLYQEVHSFMRGQSQECNLTKRNM